MTTKGKATAPTTALKNTQQLELYQRNDSMSRPLQKKTSIFMAALILLRLQARLYSAVEQKSVLPIVDALLRSYVGGA